ncbi:MAG: hypothetical protein R6V10_12065, partial [bacterium]
MAKTVISSFRYRLRGLLVCLVLVSFAVSGCPKLQRFINEVKSEVKQSTSAEDKSKKQQVDAMTHFSYAQLLALEGRREQAIEELLSAIKADPDTAYVRTVLAYNLLKEGRALEAQGWAEEAV